MLIIHQDHMIETVVLFSLKLRKMSIQISTLNSSTKVRTHSWSWCDRTTLCENIIENLNIVHLQKKQIL